MRLGTIEVEVVDGSIVELDVEVIVNAANSTLAGGGGVDGAIHRAAGPKLKEAGLAFPEVRPGVRCEPGDVRVTPGFGLKARQVIHTVGPVWRGGEQREPELLASCYRKSLEQVEALNAASVAFPAISTGAFGYPASEAVEIAVREVRAFSQRTTREVRVVFACLGVAMTKAYARALQQ